MARLAMDAANAPELRGWMVAEFARFVAPRRRAVEHTGTHGGPIEARGRPARLDHSRLSVEELRVLHGLVVKATPGRPGLTARPPSCRGSPTP